MPGHFSRRAFVAGLGFASVCSGAEPGEDSRLVLTVRRLGVYTGRGIAFPAVAAARMPEVLLIDRSTTGMPMHGTGDVWARLRTANYIEFRKYANAASDKVLHSALERNGIRSLLAAENGAFLFGFATLEGREKVWRELCANKEWAQGGAQLQELGIYRANGNDLKP